MGARRTIRADSRLGRARFGCVYRRARIPEGICARSTAGIHSRWPPDAHRWISLLLTQGAGALWDRGHFVSHARATRHGIPAAMLCLVVLSSCERKAPNQEQCLEFAMHALGISDARLLAV